MLPSVSIDDFVTDPQMLGKWFAGDSWRNWRLILRAVFGEQLSPREAYQFAQICDRSPPTRRVKEFWAGVGRRGGKDAAISACLAYVSSLTDFRDYLRPGEKASCICLACDRAQAAIVFNYVKAYFQHCDLLRPLVRYIGSDYLELKNDTEIVIVTNSFRALRGRTVALGVLDENCWWRDETSANPDVEVYSSLRPALVTLPGSMLLGISSVYRRHGLYYTKWREFGGTKGEGNNDILVIKAPSRTFNPTIDQAEIDADIASDPARYSAEWLSEFREDVQDYIGVELLQSLVSPGVTELPPTGRYQYVGFTDTAGGSGSDSFTIAIAHLETRGSTDVAVLDLVHEIRPNFDPEIATQTMCDILKRFRLVTVTGDKFAGDWPSSAYGRFGVMYQPSERTKSEIYLELLPVLTSRRCELLDHPRLLNQFQALERRVARGGRSSVDHPPGGHDDIANAAAGALTLLVSDDRSAIVKRYLLRGSGRI